MLTYHRVDWPDHRPWLCPGLISAMPDDFSRQLAWIRERLRPVSMVNVLEAHRTGGIHALAVGAGDVRRRLS